MYRLLQGGFLVGSAEGMPDWPIRREAEQIAADRKWAEELTAIERGQALRGSDGNYMYVIVREGRLKAADTRRSYNGP